jgi:hypothetical protein
LVLEATATLEVASPTVRVAEAAEGLLPLLVDVTAPMGRVLVKLPTALVVTLTETVHDELAGIEPPLRVSPVELAVPPESVPPQVLDTLGVDATVIPEGKLSVNASPVVAVLVDGLVLVIARVLAPPYAMLVGVKLLLAESPFTTRVIVLLVALLTQLVMPV